MFEDRKPDCMSFDSGSTGQSGQPGGPYTYSYSYPSPGEDPGASRANRSGGDRGCRF